MAPDRTVVLSAVRSAPFLPLNRGENPMKLTRLDFAQHPRPPQRELRQRGVFDSGGSLIGHVADLYADDARTIRFVDVAMSGFMGLGKEHHPVPIEAVAEEEHDSVTPALDRRALESTPPLGDAHAAPEGTMHVRVSTMRVLEDQFDRILSFHRESMIPATEMQAGFRGGVTITDRSASKIVTASWWDSRARMEYTGRCAHLPEQISNLVHYLADVPETEDYQLDTTT
jgi:hypothetical protein